MSQKQSGQETILDPNTLHDVAKALFLGPFHHNPTQNKARRIGLEIELPFFKRSDLSPLSFYGSASISRVLSLLQGKYGWSSSEVESGVVTGLHKNRSTISLEPGGQIELSTRPHATLVDLSQELSRHYESIDEISRDIGVGVLPFGFHPHTEIQECPYIDQRSRFAALRSVFAAEKGYAAWMQSSSVQVTLDAHSITNAFDLFRVGLALQPIAAAIFANSPFSKNRISPYQSWRRQNLLSLDSPYYRVPDSLFHADYGIDEWIEHILCVPMSFVVRDGKYVAISERPFSHMIGQPLPELQNIPTDEQYLTEKDLLDHMTGIKPEMMLKPGLLLECRAADLGPSPDENLAVAALWVGLLYDEAAFEQARSITMNWDDTTRHQLRHAVAQQGLKTRVQNVYVQDVALQILTAAQEGLSRLEPDSASLLDSVIARVKRGMSPADEALHRLSHQHQGDIGSFLRATMAGDYSRSTVVPSPSTSNLVR